MLDEEDACPDTPGSVDRQCCPVGDEIMVTLHIVNQPKSDACPGSKPSCKLPLAGASVRVFDRNNADFQALWTDDVGPNQYPGVFEADVGRIAHCETESPGQCTAGEETAGDYLVIAKYLDVETGTNVYTGKPKSPEDFVDTDGDTVGDLASKELQILKIIKKDGTIKWAAGARTVVNGSFLEIVYPQYTIWDDAAAAGFVYPFIFTSDSDWEVDICGQVPEGYDIVGVYDGEGNLIPDESCAQTFVTGETKVVAFDVVEVGSPRPMLGASLTVEHEGAVTAVDIEVPGERTYVEEPAVQPAQLPTTGAGDSGQGGMPAWPAFAAGAIALAAGAWCARRRWLR